MRFWRRKRNKEKLESPPPARDGGDQFPLKKSLQDNVDRLKRELGNSPDLIIRTFELGISPRFQVVIAYIDSLVDRKMIDEWVMKSLMIDSVEFQKTLTNRNAMELIQRNALTICKIDVLDQWDQVFESILSGNAILFGEGWNQIIAADTTGGSTKPVSEPLSQIVVRGPKDSFTESIRTNIGLVRMRVKTPNLWLKKLTIGSLTKTEVAVMYIQGVANEKIVKDVMKKLKSIEIDGILESGYIEAFIENKSWTPFPTIYSTERPDVISGNLLEGRVAILIDNSPYALVLPASFNLFFQSVEDYYQRFDISTFLRLLRYTAFIVSFIAPSIYIALTTYHPEMIPTDLLINLAGQREGIPFPALVEAFLMEVIFEVIREAGIRAPKALSTAVTIVGAIVLGQTAVQSGLVTPVMVIVVALTAIASFVNPSFNVAIAARMIRFIYMILAGTFGMFGISLALIMTIAHMNTLYSYGTPYLAPFSPFIPEDHKDTVIRLPIWALRKRPSSINPNNPNRFPRGIQPPQEPGSGDPDD
ncbi:spore germination protein [Paenactinomyces guangxiensis]|uniref:Spore germination protein n=1 Tax=Paenactinomyces guangxiensis TaxID=1490290 RepID=A0A7W1WRJ7_9BACL|nr:spore germination protein [Paenactinomyces guangxiensis]MBA4494768.1 spore germination protein [Paenactinomyces guangxiensis]MBH8591852.1 spore germination protein [Paenactinomyces guangxiensis]